MSGIRGKNTKPEIAVRRGLHAQGFRFRLHVDDVPGKPDLVLPRFKATIFVNGCFWHGHNCHLFRIPSTRQEFWTAKIGRNVHRDAIVRSQLKELGWRSLIVWECAVKGRTHLGIDVVVAKIADWLHGSAQYLEIEGA